MKKVKAMLASLLAFLVGMGMIMPNLSQVYAQGSDDYGVVGAYEAYSIAENLYENGKKVKTGNEMIRIRKNPKGGSKEVGEIAYCFNADRAVPDIQGATPDFIGEDYSEDTLITYTKVAGTVSKFSSLAVNARENARSQILKVMYNGFRNGDANRVDEIKNAFKAKYPNMPEGNISDAELYAATQKAIWYYTDSQELATQKPSEAEIKGNEIDATMNTKTWYVYQFLLGQALTDDNPLKGMTLNEVQGNNTLDLYKPARALQLNNGYQNLLSSKFVASNTETNYSEFDVKIKKIDKDGNSLLANARLKLEAVNNGNSDQRLFMWTTKEDGGLNPTTFKLPAGEYLLTELSAPEGYKLAEPITVKVSATGGVTYNIKNKAETTNANDKTVVMVNEKTQTMTVNVNKEWKDKNDATPSVLDFLTTKVKLLADGQPAVDASGHAVPEQLLSKGNQWKASFKNLPIYKNGTNSGEKIVYTVSESEMNEGYKLIQGGDAKVSGDADKDVKAIQLVNKETDTTEPEQTLITKVQVNKKWSNQDKKSSRDIYFELWKVKDGSESVVSLADFALKPKAFQARQKLPSNGTMVIWDKLYLKEQGYTFKVKEVDESGNAWQDKANGYKEGSAKVESNVDKAKQLMVFDVTNNYEEAAKTKVKFSKKALTETGAELSGAKLKLAKKDGTVVKEWTTDGTQVEVELENGSYTLTEVSAPSNYQVAPAINFEVKDGKVTVDGKDVNGNKLVMVDKLKGGQIIHITEKTKVKFSKKALTETGEELSGAKLKLAKKDGTFEKEWITDGKVIELELENGSYTLTEVSAPDKYKLAPAISFEVKDGKVTVNGKVLSTNKLVMVDKLKGGQIIHLIEKTKVKFSKKALTETGEELSGAKLKLAKKDGTFEKEWITDGKVIELELENGTYTLTEVSAPDKYKLAPAISFEVKDGKVTVNGKVLSTNKLVMVDKLKDGQIIHITEKTKVKFSKKALTETGEELSGAKLKLTKKDGTFEKEWITDGKVIELELENGTYTLTEVSAPDKYKLAPAINFEVKDGKVTVNGKELSENKLVMVDKMKLVEKIKEYVQDAPKIKEYVHDAPKTTVNLRKAPKTGVVFNPSLYVGIMSLAGGALIFLETKRKNK